MGVGDIVSQQVVEKAGLKNHNAIRTVRQASFGLIIGVRASSYLVLFCVFAGLGFERG